MLKIKVPENLEFWDPAKQEFFYNKAVVVKLEHSLISISKWEAIWEKPFLPTTGVSEGLKGYMEEISYIACMVVGNVPRHIPPTLYHNYGREVRNYISKKNTATIINRIGPKIQSRRVVTSELIYYWMIRYNIPFECDRWHLNRLLTLVDICNVKENEASKKGALGRHESAMHRHKLNEARKMGL
jgi:hypothetical protein